MADKQIKDLTESSSLANGDVFARDNASNQTRKIQASDVRTYMQVGTATDASLSSHVGDTSNPHSVTAAQAGALADVVDDTTPQLGGNLDINGNNITGYTGDRAVITTGGGAVTVSATGSTQIGYLQTVSSNVQTQIDNTNTSLSSHATDTSNPHSVTAAQTGGIADVVDDTTPQLGGDLDTNGNQITSASNADVSINPNGSGDVLLMKAARLDKQAYQVAIVDNGNSGASKTIDWTSGLKQEITMTSNCTFTFTDPAGPCNTVLKISQDASGSRTITWDASCWFSGGTAPTLTSTGNAVDIACFFFDGTYYHGDVLTDTQKP